MSALSRFLQLYGDALLFSLFFGTVALLAVVETRAALSKLSVDRQHRWPVNILLTVINIVVMGAIPVTGTAAAFYAKGQAVGLMNLTELPFAVALPLSFLIFSLQSWVVHFAMHHVRLFWLFHRVHHTDTQMDVSTTVRFHPGEIALQAPIGALVIIAAGAPPEAVILYGILDALVNVFSHSNVRLPARLEAALAWLIVTPHLHRIHHSPWQPETDSNFGATLPLWDRLFGTFRQKLPDDLAAQRIGLDDMQDRRAASLWWALTLPFRSIKGHTEGEKNKRQP